MTVDRGESTDGELASLFAVANLDALERMVIALRFGDRLTLGQTGDKLTDHFGPVGPLCRYTAERVRRIERDALAKLGGAVAVRLYHGGDQ